MDHVTVMDPIITQPKTTIDGPGNLAPKLKDQWDKDKWSTADVTIEDCPKGLEPLMDVEHIFVKQQVELMEAITGWETRNQYWIKNSIGKILYFAIEDNDCITRQCAGTVRPFTMRLLDHGQKEVIKMYRPFRCDTPLCPCCLQEMEIMAEKEVTVGWVTQRLTFCFPRYLVKNAERNKTELWIDGPFCTCSCLTTDVVFKVVDSSGKEVGKITKHWSGFAKELYTDADLFGISFPRELSPKIKASLIGAVLLIDYMFFEDAGCSRNMDCPGMCC